MSMSVGMLDHYNVSTRNLRDTVRFYEEVLGLVNGPRPPFDFPGAWLYSEGHPLLHLNDISPTDKPRLPKAMWSMTPESGRCGLSVGEMSLRCSTGWPSL